MDGKGILIEKIIKEKDKQFDNLMNYAISGNTSYLQDIEIFFKTLNEIDLIFEYGLSINFHEEYHSCIDIESNNVLKKDRIVANILKLYAIAYSKIERLGLELLEDNIKDKGRPSSIKDYFVKHKKTILVIDDDILMLKAIEESMKKRRYDVITCSNSFEAIKIIKKKEISLVVLDMVLPGIDGFEMTKLIRKIQSTLPIIIISAKTDIKTKIDVLKIGADDYITKPFKEEEFFARIDRALDRIVNFNFLSIEDRLTGTYTKEYFWKRIREAKDLYNRNGKTFSVGFIDIDNFKNINDNYGHLVGDQKLKCFARTLKNSLRSTDQVFRFGGDEFIIIFPETNEKNAHLVLERFKNKEICFKCNEIRCNALIENRFSAGVTEVKDINDNVENIIKRADKALYKAKSYGGNKICIHKGLNLKSRGNKRNW